MNFEIVLPGFDGASDATDHLIIWVSAPNTATFETAIAGFPVRGCRLPVRGLPGIDYHLPRDTARLADHLQRATFTLEEFRATKRLETKDEAWCEEHGGLAPQQIAQYVGGFIFIDDTGPRLVIENMTYDQPLAELEEILYDWWKE